MCCRTTTSWRRVARGWTHHVAAEHRRAARGRRGDGAENPHQRRLAGAVRSEQAVDHALRNLERHAVERVHPCPSSSDRPCADRRPRWRSSGSELLEGKNVRSEASGGAALIAVDDGPVVGIETVERRCGSRSNTRRRFRARHSRPAGSSSAASTGGASTSSVSQVGPKILNGLISPVRSRTRPLGPMLYTRRG